MFDKNFHKTKTEKETLKESDKAQARADDDGFAIQEKKEDMRTK